MFERMCGWFAYGLIRILSWTYRYRVLGKENLEDARKIHPESSYLLAFWHEFILTTVTSQEGIPYRALVSDSWDGRLIAFCLRKFGYQTVHGSQIRNKKDKGGLRALLKLFQEVKLGAAVAVAVDGSIGPRRHAKQGILDLGRKSGSPILPFAAHYSRYWELNTWDRFKIPKPFATVAVSYGKPLVLEKTLRREEFEAVQAQLGEAIDQEEVRAKQSLEKL